MNEKFPQPNKILIDRRDIDNKYVDSDFEETYFDDYFFEKFEATLEDLKPSLEDFFNRVISEQPDYIVLLDKGARLFGVPFNKYLKDLKLDKKIEILFFNDDTYKKNFKNSKEIQDELKKNFIDSCSEKNFLNKKIFVVDEAIYKGRGAKRIQEFFDNNHIDGNYFTFSNEGEENIDKNLKNDKRFTVYDDSYLNNFQVISSLYVSDVDNLDTGIIETKRRFASVEDLDFDKKALSYQEKIKKKRNIVYSVRKRMGDMVYKTLKEINLNMLEFFNKQNKIEIQDVPKYQSSFSRDTIIKKTEAELNNLEKNRPWIILPEELYNATIQMCQAERETRGVFIIDKKGEAFKKGRLPVAAMISIGYGTSTSVYPDEEKFNTINNLLQDYKDVITVVDFHSHTLSTGDHWEDKFSGQDNQALSNNVNRHRGYMHVLFTPKNILTFGMGKPQFVVTKFDNENKSNETQEFWKQKFDEYLSNNG